MSFPEFPGALPVLEVDGMKLCGQTAICRQLAWRFVSELCQKIGLSGKTVTEDSTLDMFADLLLEARVVLFGSSDDQNDCNANVRFFFSSKKKVLTCSWISKLSRKGKKKTD
ncbi:unnamed protein product [Gongylonema pulchrum]|uniref:FSA_C domain-containing protein n=1 Tax=Gongylonema pulchrum TaxID=637853 RepID=A0A183CY11_9BILA|nr:unnamed protein product [Gongylonema pulchrum]